MSRSRYNKYDVMSRCIFCGRPVYYFEVRNTWQKVHTECANQAPPDFKYTHDDFTLELRSTLISPRLMKKIFNNI